MYSQWHFHLSQDNKILISFPATLLKVIYGRWIEDHSATSKFHILLSVTLYTWQNVRYDVLPFWSVQVSSRESVSGINISHHKIFALHWTFFTPSNSIETKKYPSMKKKKKKKGQEKYLRLQTKWWR